jgi:hypothetical protein
VYLSYAEILTDNGHHLAADLREIEVIGKAHPHRDVIIAYANGAEIEYLSRDGYWVGAKSPSFSALKKFRINPSPTPKEKEITSIRKEMESLSERLKQLESE